MIDQLFYQNIAWPPSSPTLPLSMKNGPTQNIDNQLSEHYTAIVQAFEVER